MNIAKRPYEISLWEDVLTFVGKQKKDGKIVEMEGFIPSTFEGTIEGQYYKEVKLCIIGSDTMSSPARCVNPKLTQKINGENTLTFTMYYRYWDDEAQNFVHNPYNRYMVNERKIKLRLGPEATTEDDANCQWFDFIIKNVQENSETKAFTYTCKDQFVNELSKSGFELVLDNELENNMGTIDVLADRVLEGSDWQVDGADSENLKQYKEEPLYKIKVNQDLTATALETGDELEVKTSEYIYVFYSIINDKKKKIQFLYPGEENEFVADDNLLIDKKLYLNYELDGEFEYNKGKDNEWPSFVAETGGILDANISTKYRGARLVKQAQTKYDSTIDKYVGVYKKDEVTYYGYTENEYISSGAIINYAANPSAFTSTTGWETDAHHLDYKLESVKNGELYTSYLGVDFTKFKPSGEQEPEQELPQIWVKNAGIAGNRSSIGSFKEGEKYVLRMKYKASLNGAYMTTAPTAKICEYHLNNDSKYVLTNEVDGEDTYEIFDFDSATLGENSFPKKTNDIAEDGTYTELSNYVYMVATCARSISERNLKDWDFKIGLFFNFNTTDTIYIEDVQIFPYETYNDGVERLCVPGGKLHSEVRTKYIYYKPNKEWKSIEDLEASYSGYINDQTYLQEFNIESDIPGVNGFTKVRSISAKESNRFNLIQDLCETFECWAKLKVKRNQKTGQIKLDENFRQMKSISFHEYIGRDNYVGFRYGINSKSISRTLDSAAIVSKMIVKDNANEFAPNGFCSIARASENPTGENFLLNFDHYARQGLLDFDLITNDLYLDVNGYLGYYKKLKRLNAQRNEKIDIQSGLLIDISNYQSAYTTYKTSYDSAVENQLEHERDFNKLAGTNYDHDNFASNVENMGELSDDLNKYWVKWTQCQNVITQHKPLYEKAKINLDNATVQYEEIQQWLENLAEQKRALNLQFYKKYSRFIQEGSWIKEDYTDPNLYYLDSESTLHTSAQPKVTYDIKVIDVAPLASQEGCEDFAHYDFKIGDKTYIEDVEFFGWSLQNRSQPYREEIVVSEITTELDAPEKNQIKVQNYKTQFEDLFQRITAQTQQAEYHTGEYQRAAAIVEKDGTLSVDTLENSFANNSFKLSNARDQSVVWDESGITTTSLSNPSEMVRIISGGIFLSTDGGASWKTGVTGGGINTSCLTAGQINTNEIIIRSGSFSSFRWDSLGLNAYSFQLENDQPHSFNMNKFVRFDQYGIYGIDGNSNFIPSNEDAIWQNENTKYALTWKGFMLKSNNGSVRISSEDDIQVIDSTNAERIKIGHLGSGIYGIRISKGADQPVMVTDSEGDLWLKDRLRIGEKDGQFNVEIGNLIQGETQNPQVINANNGFIVYSDGSIKATSGQIACADIVNNEIIINDAAFKIKSSDEEQLLYYSKDKEKLVVKGRVEADEGYFKGKVEADEGYFKGRIEADEGYFKGRIEADSGFIGSMKLENGLLTSGDETQSKLSISTITGEINAERISIGKEAEITDYIVFKDENANEIAGIYNPKKYDNKFIQAGLISIKANGEATFGEISINGRDSKIQGNKFEITSDYANFSNINCSGSIETLIFKKNFVQAAGGAMIFKPSYRIENIENIESTEDTKKDLKKILYLEDNYDGEIGSSVWLIKNKIQTENENGLGTEYAEATVDSIDETNKKKIIVLLKLASKQKYELLVDLGDIGQDFLMGINAGNSRIGPNQELEGRGLTIWDYSKEVPSPSLFLGDLSTSSIKIGNKSLSGYGLYCDNVYLNGSLVTTSSTGHTAGVNTTSQENGLDDYVGDTSPIIFWAGAGGEKDVPINKAPFQVTERGYVRATQAKFSESVFAEGTIVSTSIRTAKIFGNGPTNEPALSVYGTKTGISFYEAEDSQETFQITATSFGRKYQNQLKDFITLEPSITEGNSNGVIFTGRFEGSLKTGTGQISETNSEMLIKIANETKMVLKSNEIELKETVKYRGSNILMEYRPSEAGYNLYITEA